MVAKKSESSTLKDTIMSVVSSKVIGAVRDNLKDFMKDVQEKIYHTEKIILQKLFATVILSLGAVFVLVGVITYLQEYLFWNKTQSFMIVGLVLILVSFTMKYFIMKNQFNK